MFRVSAVSTSALLRSVRSFATKAAKKAKVSAPKVKKVKAACAPKKATKKRVVKKSKKVSAAVRERKQKVKAANKERRAAAKEKKALAKAAKKQRRTARRELKVQKKAAKLLAKRRRAVLAKPWKAMGTKSLPNRGLSVFVKEQFRGERKGKEAATVVLKRLAAKWKGMKPAARAPFEATAKKNGAARAAAKAKVAGSHTSPYTLFVKEKFAAAAKGVSGSATKKLPVISRKIAGQWKALSAADRKAYATKAVAIKDKAIRAIDALIKK